MHRRALAPCAAIELMIAAVPIATRAQDAARMQPRSYRVVLDNDKVRVLAFAARPGILPKAPSYKLVEVDLNGDGRPESIVYLTDQQFCGSGGCNLYVLSSVSGGYQLRMRATIVQLPIRLLPSSSHGWRDIGVTVSGGGVDHPYKAVLKFDGHRYPSNPSMPPAVPLHKPVGQELIAR